MVSDGNNVQAGGNAGGPTALAATAITGTLTIGPTNDPPVVDLNGAGAGRDNAVTFTEGANVAHVPVTVAGSATLTDADNTRLTQMVLTVGGVVDGDSEILTIGSTAFALATDANDVDVGSFRVSYASTTGVFTIVPDGSGVATVGGFQTLLRGITYVNTTDDPTAGNRTIAVEVTDAGFDDGTAVGGEEGSNLATTTLTVVPANDQPVITGLNAASFFENAVNATPAVIDGDVTLTDIDSPDYAGGSLRVSGLVAGQDVVSLPTGAAALAGNVQINGADVEYFDGSSWVVVGTHSGGSGSDFVVSFNGDATPAIVERVVESLTFANTADNPTTGRTLTIAVNDGDGNPVQAATVGVTVRYDNDAPSMSATVLGGSYTEQNATGLALVGGTVTVSDPDGNANFYNGGANVGSLTVALDGYQAGDRLYVLNQGTGAGQIGVSGNTISYGGVAFATLSGGNGADLTVTFTSNTATPAAVQALLTRLRFDNLTNDDPTVDGTDPTRAFTVTLNDGANTRDPASSTGALTATLNGTITVVPAADNPVVTPAATVGYVENSAPVALSPALALTDADDAQISGATVSIGAGRTSGDLLSAATAGTSITWSYDSGTGVLTLSGTDTVANYRQVLRSVSFESSSEDPTTDGTAVTRTILWSVTDANSDGAGPGTGTASTTLTVTPLADAPVLAGGGQDLAYTENDAAAVIDATVNVASDADDTLMGGATVTLSAGLTSGDLLGFANQNGITGSYDAGTGVLTLSGNATLAQYTAALQSVTFRSTSDDPTAVSTTRTITWQVTDADSDGAGAAASNTVTSTITVNATPDLVDDTAVTDEDNSVVVAVLANDDQGTPTGTVSGVTDGSHGTVAINPDGTVTYTPNADYHGSDTFTYTVTDGNGDSRTATVTVTVNPVVDIADDTAETDEDTAVTTTVLGNDTFEGTPVVTAVTQGANGTVTINADNTITYTPNADFNGTDSYTYTVTSPAGITETATVNVTVWPVVDIADDTAETDEDTAVTTTVLGNDTFEGTPVVTAVTQGANGTVTINADNTITYTPNADFNGTDSYTYTVTSPAGITETATVNVTVNAGASTSPTTRRRPTRTRRSPRRCWATIRSKARRW